jgi:DNA-binding transcriptional LysR family regulator
MVSKLSVFLAAYPDMAVEMAASESPTTIIEDGFDLAIHSGDLPDSSLVTRKFAQTTTILVPLLNTSHATVRLSRRTISVAFDQLFLSSEAQCSRGALARGKTRSALSLRESFEPAILNRCGWVSLNIWGLPRHQHGFSR